MSTRTEIEQRVAAFAAAQTPPLKVSYENVPFTRPTDEMWLEVILKSANTVTATVDASTNRERGSICVVVWCPVGKGLGKLDTLVEKIVKLFPVIPKTGTVSIEDPMNTSQFMKMDDGWGAISCVCPYRVESMA